MTTYWLSQRCVDQHFHVARCFLAKRSSQFVCIGQSGAIFHGLSHGLSKFNSITTEDQWAVAGRSFIASEILAILTLCLAKCCTILLMHRVFSSNAGWKLWLRIAIFLLSVAWGLAGIILVATHCNADLVLTSRSVEVCPAQVSSFPSATRQQN